MKKFLILMLSLALAVCALTGAIAEEQTEETNWYEVTDESVLYRALTRKRRRMDV